VTLSAPGGHADIATEVHVGKNEMDVGAGDQKLLFGYAIDETENCMPLTHAVATQLGKTFTDVRMDGKTQVTLSTVKATPAGPAGDLPWFHSCTLCMSSS